MGNNSTEIVKTFYEALNNGDIKTVRQLYHPDAVYKSEMFSLKGPEVFALWYTATQPEMNLTAECSSINKVNNEVHTTWNISYELSVVNRTIKLSEKGLFKFKDGKIIFHQDKYSFYSWCKQTLGPIGWLFGWTAWLKKRVSKQALKTIHSNIYSAQFDKEGKDE
ncbi:MAG: nuclear transport factor 2 family protein [Balneolaceae bacterium]|nr:nuclear transport factor 2 family protein [Balneolaceae bacterium]